MAHAAVMENAGMMTSSPDDPVQDQALMQAVAAGDQQAFAQVYARHAAAVLRTAIKYLKDRSAAEDLLHDVFIEARRRADNFNPVRGDIGAWLTVLTKSRAIDRIRSINRYARLIENYQAEPVHESESISDDVLFRDRLPGLLSTLSDGHRRVVELFYLEELSQLEIADRLGIPVGTVKSRLHFAMGHLQKQIARAP